MNIIYRLLALVILSFALSVAALAQGQGQTPGVTSAPPMDPPVSAPGQGQTPGITAEEPTIFEILSSVVTFFNGSIQYLS
jgi:hypothetical protein